MGDKLKRCGPAAEAQMMSENVRPSYRMSPTERLAKYDCRADRQVERVYSSRPSPRADRSRAGHTAGPDGSWSLYYYVDVWQEVLPACGPTGGVRAQSITVVEL